MSGCFVMVVNGAERGNFRVASGKEIAIGYIAH